MYGKYTSVQSVEVLGCNELGYEPEFLFEMICTARGRPEVWHLSNGDPGYPAEAAEWEVERIFVSNSKDNTPISETRLAEIVGDEIFNTLVDEAVTDALENYEEPERDY